MYRSAASAAGIGDLRMRGAPGIVPVLTLTPGIHLTHPGPIVVSQGFPAAAGALYLYCVGYLC